MTNFSKPLEAVPNVSPPSEEGTLINIPVSDAPSIRGGKKLRVAILGNGNVATQIIATMNLDRTEYKVFDKETSKSPIDDVIEYGPNLTFVCIDVSFLPNDTLDDAELIDIVSKLLKLTEGGVCLKTTINPETCGRLVSIDGAEKESFGNRFVYSPETTHSSDPLAAMRANEIVLGGSENAVNSHVAVLDVHFVQNFSRVTRLPFMEAVLLVMGVAAFTAIKQTFFSQMAEVTEEHDVPFNRIRRIMANTRIVNDLSYTVPPIEKTNHDNTISLKMAKGFGGEYLNHDVKSLLGVTDKMPLLDECINWKNVKG